VIGFDDVIRVLLGDVARGGYQLFEHSRVGRCPIGIHFGGARAVLQGAGEEPAGGRQIPLLGYQYVDDLAELIDRPIQIDPPPGDFYIGLVYEPPAPGQCRRDRAASINSGVNRCTQR
jgi:hypothetical protein